MHFLGLLLVWKVIEMVLSFPGCKMFGSEPDGSLESNPANRNCNGRF